MFFGIINIIACIQNYVVSKLLEITYVFWDWMLGKPILHIDFSAPKYFARLWWWMYGLHNLGGVFVTYDLRCLLLLRAWAIAIWIMCMCVLWRREKRGQNEAKEIKTCNICPWAKCAQTSKGKVCESTHFPQVAYFPGQIVNVVVCRRVCGKI